MQNMKGWCTGVVIRLLLQKANIATVEEGCRYRRADAFPYT